jgi:hypothetical protein
MIILLYVEIWNLWEAQNNNVFINHGILSQCANVKRKMGVLHIPKYLPTTLINPTSTRN